MIVPSFNSREHIRDCLNSLQNQAADVPFEILVVDSSSDGTDRLIADEYPQIRLLHFADRVCVGRARNIGIQATHGDIIVFMDSDCVAGSDWLRGMLQGLRELNADGVCGSIANGTPGSVSGSVGFLLEFFRFLPSCEGPSPARFLLGGNCAYRRHVLNGHAYAEDTTAGEDFLFSSEIAHNGGALYFLPSCSVIHRNKTGLSRVLRYQYRLGQSAHWYRSVTSPKWIRFLRLCPFALVAAVPWIVAHVVFKALRRQGMVSLPRVAVLSPFLTAGNAVWAFGFIRGLAESRRS